MRVAVPAEVKNHEYRVAITPVGVSDLPGDTTSVRLVVVEGAQRVQREQVLDGHGSGECGVDPEIASLALG